MISFTVISQYLSDYKLEKYEKVVLLNWHLLG